MKKQEEQPKPEINIFLKKDWSIEDYNNQNQELLKIGEEYRKCYEIWENNKDNKRKFATEYFQIRNGGMTEDLRVIRNGNFELNNAKIDKYFKWVEFNKTSYEKEEDKKIVAERFGVIRDLMAKLT